MTRILIVTSGSGALIDICLGFSSFREAVVCIAVDRACNAIQVAERHGVAVEKIFSTKTRGKSSGNLSASLLRVAKNYEADYILLYSFLRIVTGTLLIEYHGRIFNSHFSLLPAFRGVGEDPLSSYGIRRLFERSLEYGSLIIGNTIHEVTENVDCGRPVMVGAMAVNYSKTEEMLRHQLFLIECKMMIQFVYWLSENRLESRDGRFGIARAKYKSTDFVPSLERQDVLKLYVPLR
jgi:phosphoribosylglycinamide formyltransferase-1